jgi:anti-sigma regulatory factor (Ser/Thr protein kinase)
MVVANCLELALPAVPKSVPKARLAVREAITELTDDEHVVDDVVLCVSEAVTNAVRYAYGPRGGVVEVLVDRTGSDLAVVVRDEGAGLTPARRPGTGGGFGLRIIDRLAARYSLKSHPHKGTELRMVFVL